MTTANAFFVFAACLCVLLAFVYALVQGVLSGRTRGGEGRGGSSDASCILRVQARTTSVRNVRRRFVLRDVREGRRRLWSLPRGERAVLFQAGPEWHLWTGPTLTVHPDNPSSSSSGTAAAVGGGHVTMEFAPSSRPRILLNGNDDAMTNDEASSVVPVVVPSSEEGPPVGWREVEDGCLSLVDVLTRCATVSAPFESLEAAAASITTGDDHPAPAPRQLCIVGGHPNHPRFYVVEALPTCDRASPSSSGTPPPACKGMRVWVPTTPPDPQKK